MSAHAPHERPARTTSRPGPVFLPFGIVWLQFGAVSLLAFLALIGRKQGGDKPIAASLRALYAAVILAALILVVRAFVRERRRLLAWVLRVVARARRRPVLALWLAFWLGLGLSWAIPTAIPVIGGGIETLWSGGARDTASFTGDNRQSVVVLLPVLLLLTDIGALAIALGWLGWGSEARARRGRRRVSAN